MPASVYKIVFIFLMTLPAFNTTAQGLQFNSNDSLLSKRTSYSVFKNDPPTFSGHLYINFDLSLWDNEHLGYILNITDTKKNSYSLSSIYNGAPFLNFNIDSKSNKIRIPLMPNQLKKRNWMKIRVDIDLKANTAGVCINGKWYRSGGFDFDGTITPKIFFGKNEHYFDVPKMAIRNLTIGDDRKTYYFPLNEWMGRNVYSSERDNLGYADNPVWLINESYFWTPRYVRGFKEVAGVNFDEAGEKLYMFKSDSLIQYDVRQNSVLGRAYQNKCPVPLHLGKSIIDTKARKLYAYETLKPPGPAPSIAALDLETLKWDIVGSGTITEQRHHHNIFYNKNQDSLYLFGGYGSYSYYKDFFRYNKAADKWEKIVFTGDKINPRFFSGYSVADDNNDIYIFGGYGNQSGNQVVGGQHYYDFYRVNLTSHTVKKCWEIKPPADDFVAANNLIISKDHKYFYAICYAHDKPKTSLRLYKFSIKDGTHEIVSGSIPAKGERIESDINLFYDHTQEVFYCTIQEFSTPDYSTIRIYSLASPPVRELDYLASQQVNVTGRYFRTVMPYLLIILIAVLAIAIFFYLRQKRRKNKTIPEDTDVDSTAITVHKKDDEKQPNAVYLLGEFTVYDKNSKDITYLFSPKIKQLFILILLNSKDGSGVVSKKISATLWPDKDIGKTKNIKGVTINHLRNILADINGVELTFLNDTYCFKLSSMLFCDYFIVMDAIEQMHKARQPDDTLLTHFDLVARGGLLPHIPETWLDDIKLNYEEALMPEILPEAKRVYESGDYRKAIEIARVILNIDPFNDTAIKYKLKALRRVKGIEYAHKIYNDFIAEYEKSLGEPYPVPFEKICK